MNKNTTGVLSPFNLLTGQALLAMESLILGHTTAHFTTMNRPTMDNV